MKEAIRLKHMFYVLRCILVSNKIKLILPFPLTRVESYMSGGNQIKTLSGGKGSAHAHPCPGFQVGFLWLCLKPSQLNLG